MSYQPLEGVRVLDLARLYAGALTTMKLADLGADVVKVEEPGRGDYLRTIPPVVEDRGLLHLLCDRGKSSIELDVTTAQGRQRFDELAAVADVIVESGRPGALRRKGIDLTALREVQPHLVLCSLTGFGQTGPMAQAPAHGMNMDALAGTGAIGERDGRPALVPRGYSVGVELGAANAALAITAAVLHARATGVGTWVDASCWDAAVDALRVRIATELACPEQEEQRLGPLYDVYETADGKLVLFCAIERKFWEAFCRGVGREDLLERWTGTDVDFGEQALRGELEAIFAEHPLDYWDKRLQEWDIPGCPILEVSDLPDHPHFEARGIIQRRGPSGVPVLANPIRWAEDGTRPGAEAREAPGLGVDTEQVLARWLGEEEPGA